MRSYSLTSAGVLPVQRTCPTDIADAAAEIQSKLARSEHSKNAANIRHGNVKSCTGDTVSPVHVRVRMARAARVSDRQLKKARSVRTKSPELATKVQAGELTLDKAIKEIREIEIATQRREIAKAGASVKPSSENSRQRVFVLFPYPCVFPDTHGRNNFRSCVGPNSGAVSP